MALFSLVLDVHVPLYQKPYHFYQIGNDNHYEAVAQNVARTQEYVQQSLIPVTKILEEIIAEQPDFKVALRISGIALMLFEQYEPQAIDCLKRLAATQAVIWLYSPYYESMAALYSTEEFERQTSLHKKKLKELTGKEPEIFAFTNGIYTAEVEERLAGHTQTAILADTNIDNQTIFSLGELSLTGSHVMLARSLEEQFSNPQWKYYPLYTSVYASWVEQAAAEYGDNILVWLKMETFGILNARDSGIFDFLRHLPKDIAKSGKIHMAWPHELKKEKKAGKTETVIGEMAQMPPLSRMQQDALSKVYALEEKVQNTKSEQLLHAWGKLQAWSYFSYMTATGCQPLYITPYDAYINYMNILSDFEMQVRHAQPYKKR